MCGIVGIKAKTDKGRSSFDRLDDATASLRARGPDYGATVHVGSASLGHRRLAVIDTSPQANQPMHDESGRYTIVFNGEIYNFGELRNQLEHSGERFKSRSDTEVVLKLFIRDGATCLERLNGFFAFAIYDHFEDTLFIARDRLGIKPLYYYDDTDRFIFASELKSLAEFSIPRRLDEVSFYQYLQLNYVPAPHSIWKDTRKLEPGHYLRVDGGSLSTHRYYHIPYGCVDHDTDSRGLSRHYEAAQRRLEELLESAVRARLIADVPLGAFLSGGIDSSVIVSLAARHVDRLDTFSIGFDDYPMYDESAYADLVARHCGTRHTLFSLSTDDLYEDLFNVLDYIDEPFADPSALAVHILSRCTRKHVKVALSGDGADELFAGYNKHVGEFRARRGGTLSALLQRSEPLLRRLPRSRNSHLGNRIRQLHRFSRGAGLDSRERYWRWCSFVEEERVLGILSEGCKSGAGFAAQAEFEDRKRRALAGIVDEGNMNDVLRTDTTLVLDNSMLRKVDSMSMANGLEVRVPFLDHRVVEYAFSLPIEYKIAPDVTKRILRDTFDRYLPREVWRKPKHGFDVPLMKWFRTGLRSLIAEDLLEDRFIEEQGLFDQESIGGLRRRIFSRRQDEDERLVWSLIVFQSWWKRYMM